LVEQRIENPRVGGSIPPQATMRSSYTIQTSTTTPGVSMVTAGLLSSFLFGGAGPIAAPVANSPKYELRESAATPSAANAFIFVDVLSEAAGTHDFETTISTFYSRLGS
jgi:hypothetical protein